MLILGKVYVQQMLMVASPHISAAEGVVRLLGIRRNELMGTSRKLHNYSATSTWRVQHIQLVNVLA